MVGPDGATHQALEEIAIMRCLPNMTVLVPCDSVQTKLATKAAAKIKGPVYIRYGRESVPIITTNETPFEIGKAQTMREGKDVAIFACGNLVYESLMAADILEKKGISAKVINIHTVKPIDVSAIVSAAKACGAVVTAEEHQAAGGFGSAVCEVLSKHCPVPVETVAINDTFGASGKPCDLMVQFHLKDIDVVAAVEAVLKRKK
jgi:transketolase